MVVCILALVTFGILGIFSATHREIAKEAFECVFNRVRLKPCTSGLDKRLKSQVTGRLMKKNPRIAKFTYRHFEIISWAFTIIMAVSLLYSVFSLYSYAVYGNCEGVGSDEVCIYNQASAAITGTETKETCQLPSANPTGETTGENDDGGGSGGA